MTIIVSKLYSFYTVFFSVSVVLVLCLMLLSQRNTRTLLVNMITSAWQHLCAKVQAHIVMVVDSSYRQTDRVEFNDQITPECSPCGLSHFFMLYNLVAFSPARWYSFHAFVNLNAPQAERLFLFP